MADYENVWNKPRNFKMNSSLLAYLSEKLPDQFQWRKTETTLTKILTGLAEIIRTHTMYDTENPYMIMFGPMFELIFNARAIHINALLKRVIQYLEHSCDLEASFEKYPDQEFCTEGKTYVRLLIYAWNNPEATMHKVHKALEGQFDQFDIAANYRVKPGLLALIRSIPGTDQQKEIFPYKEITLSVSNYILGNKEVLIDARCTRVAHTKGTLLEDAFGVACFDRVQLVQLIRYNVLEKVDTEMDKAFSHLDSVLDGILPEPSKDADQPTEITIPDGGPKTPADDLNCEEILPEQISDSDGSDTLMNHDPYAVEYEIDYQSSSSDTKIYSTDNSVIEDIIVSKVYNFNTSESEPLPDLEDIIEEIKKTKPTPEPSKWKCEACKVETPKGYRFCSYCWDMRRKELPPRPKAKKGKRGNTDTNTLIKIKKNRDQEKKDMNNEPILPIEKTQGIETCPFCLSKPKDASFIHGQSAHFVSCYPCAKQQTRKSKNCPCCRRKVEKIVKVFGF